MVFPSDILAIFGRHGGTLAPTDAQIRVPPTLNAVAEIPSRVQILGNGAGFPAQTQSFVADFTQFSNNAGGAIDVSFIQLNPGLWDLNLSWMVSGNDTGKDIGVYVRTADAAPVSSFIMRVRCQFANTILSGFQTMRLSLNQVIDVRLQIQNSAAATRLDLQGSLLANRLG